MKKLMLAVMFAAVAVTAKADVLNNAPAQMREKSAASEMTVNMKYTYGKDGWVDAKAEDKKLGIFVHAIVTAADQQEGFGQQVTIKSDGHSMKSLATIGGSDESDPDDTVFSLESVGWFMIQNSKKKTISITGKTDGKSVTITPTRDANGALTLETPFGVLKSDKNGMTGVLNSSAKSAKVSLAILSYFTLMLR
ncbi:MAG: hypothetical protein PHP45_07045 [Elusimicrobiales bacterium]|nr:hypothetical protein [Elusimicrobiales bacterium]